jgi:outer membrane immunogenic protein
MHRIPSVIAVICGLAISTAASAQTPIVNWTGFYIGGHGGYQWSTVDLGFQEELPGLGDGVSLNTDGAMGGIHGGVQQQFGNYVFGIELSGDWGDGSGSTTGGWEFDNNYGQSCNPPARLFCLEAEGDDSVRVDLDSLFLAKGRIGYAWDNWLLFATGGFASAEIRTGLNRSGYADGCLFFHCGDASWNSRGSTEKRHNGWTIGGGFDAMVWQNVSFGVEYSFVRLDSETHKGILNGELDICGCEIDFKKEFDIKVDPDDIHYVNARLTFHFNSASP